VSWRKAAWKKGGRRKKGEKGGAKHLSATKGKRWVVQERTTFFMKSSRGRGRRKGRIPRSSEEP